MLDFPPEKVQPAGNIALLGAKLALFRLGENDGDYAQLSNKIRHVAPQFQKTYVEEMRFPK